MSLIALMSTEFSGTFYSKYGFLTRRLLQVKYWWIPHPSTFSIP